MLRREFGAGLAPPKERRFSLVAMGLPKPSTERDGSFALQKNLLGRYRMET